MSAILINRCTLRVIRRGGWSWRSDPKRVVQDALSRLPDLLARGLAAIFAEVDDVEFAAPIRVRVPIRIDELTEPAFWSSTAHSARTPAAFERKIDAVLRAAFGLGAEAAQKEDTDGRPDTIRPQYIKQMPAAPAAPDHVLLARLLLIWAEEGVLEQRLAACSDAQISTWHDALTGDANRAATSGSDERVAANIDAFVSSRATSLVARDPAAKLRQRIRLAAETSAQFDVPLRHGPLWQAIDHWSRLKDALPPDQERAGREIGTVEWEARVAAGITDLGPHDPPERGAAKLSNRSASIWPADAWEVSIDSALPFLLLGPLSRVGYLAALAGILDGANLTAHAPLFATALAYKVLDPPERGWRRPIASVLAASTFAGAIEPIGEDQLVAFSRRIASHTSALDSVLADAVTSGHAPGEPVVLRRADPASEADLILVDTPGCFPIVRAAGIEALRPILQALGSPVVMVSRDSASPGLLRSLAESGFTFVCDAPPTRNESWRRIHQGIARLGWTNAPEPDTEPVLLAARNLAASCGEVEDLRRELAMARPSVVRAHSPQLDRSVTIAAWIALGMIAWEIRTGIGPAGPLPALRHYHDLGARVRFDHQSVLVSLPLGRRHQELDQARLLAPIADIPWLGGRRVEFGGG